MPLLLFIILTFFTMQMQRTYRYYHRSGNMLPVMEGVKYSERRPGGGAAKKIVFGIATLPQNIHLPPHMLTPLASCCCPLLISQSILQMQRTYRYYHTSRNMLPVMEGFKHSKRRPGGGAAKFLSAARHADTPSNHTPPATHAHSFLCLLLAPHAVPILSTLQMQRTYRYNSHTGNMLPVMGGFKHSKRRPGGGAAKFQSGMPTDHQSDSEDSHALRDADDAAVSDQGTQYPAVTHRAGPVKTSIKPPTFGAQD